MDIGLKETYETLMFVDEYDHEDDVNKQIPDEDEEDGESDKDTGTVQETIEASESS